MPAWLAQAAWMLLGAGCGAVAAMALAEEAARAGLEAPSPLVASALALLALGGMAASRFVAAGWPGLLFPFSGGVACGIGLGLATPVGPLLGAVGLFVPSASVLLRRGPPVQAATTVSLPIALLSFKAASGLQLGGSSLRLLLAVAASLPVLLLLRGPWRGMAAAGTLLTLLVAML